MRLTRVLLYLVVISCLLALPVLPAQAAVGTVSVFPISGPPGTMGNISGSGFTPNLAYTVQFGAAIVATGTMSASGTFSGAQFTVPVLPRGNYNVTVTTSSDTGSTIFSIVPAISLDVSSGHVGDTIKVSATGFAASSTITIIWDSGSATSAATDPSGTFSSILMTVPPTSPGRHNISAYDGFAYSPQVGFTVYPKLSVTPNVQTVGSQITISGAGFFSNSPITFYIDNVAIGTVTASTDTTGSFSNTMITIPPLSQGSHVLLGQDFQYTSGTNNLYIRPTLKISPETGSPGTTVQLTGNGFAANAPISVTYNGASVTLQPETVTAGANGSFSASFVTPSGATGSYAVVASDGANAASATFGIASGATLNPTLGAVGTAVTITGSNFNPNTTVTVTFEGAQVASAMTNASGTFTATFKAPSARAGGHTLTLTDGFNTAATSFTILPSATVAPPSGAVDASATISGMGFGGGRAITVRFDGTQVATATSDSLGVFSASFKVPAGAAGKHQVSITDATNTISVDFAIVPGATISPAGGAVDSNITVRGSGFAAGKPIVLSFDKAQAAVATSDALGTFSATFKAPASPTGNHQVTASDGTNTATLTFAVSPGISLNPTSGYVGTNVSVKGSGFAASKPITIKYDNTQLAPAATDASGTFTATFAAPASKGGAHLVSVTDGTSTITADFTMDSTAPTVPALAQPSDAVQAEAQPVFSWGQVSDPNGVTYTLQIASDATFSNIVLEKKGLTTPGYTLSDQERLNSTGKDKPYYWRVKAVDGASNESPWSAARSFYVGFTLGAGALYIIFGAVVIIVAAFAFWMGRRTVYY